MSGRNMVEALIADERDTGVLAEMAIARIRNKLPELMVVTSVPTTPLAARQILDHVDFIEATITALSEQIANRMEPFVPVFELLLPVPGLSRMSIEVIIAETGADMSRFPSAGHLASWAGVCPGHHESPASATESAPRRLVRQLEALGHTVNLAKPAA